MWRKKIKQLSVLTIVAFLFTACSAAFWDGFVDGYNTTRYSSNELQENNVMRDSNNLNIEQLKDKIDIEELAAE